MSCNRRFLLRGTLWGAAVSAFCAVFAAVYEQFSHGVVSAYMVWAFALPLLLVAVPAAILAVSDRSAPEKWTRRFWCGGTAALTVGSLLQGALEIYGTESRWMIVYLIAGAALLLAGAGAELFK